jgi:hypothetical protein
MTLVIELKQILLRFDLTSQGKIEEQILVNVVLMLPIAHKDTFRQMFTFQIDKFQRNI